MPVPVTVLICKKRFYSSSRNTRDFDPASPFDNPLHFTIIIFPTGGFPSKLLEKSCHSLIRWKKLVLVPYVMKNEKASYSNVRYSTRLSVFLCCFTPHALRIPSAGNAAKAHANCFSSSSFRLLISSFYNHSPEPYATVL